MKQMNKTSFVAYLFGIILMGMVTGCEKDIYNPDKDKNKLPPKEDYFDFSLKGDVALSVNYASQDLKILFEVYDEYPLNESGYSKKEGVKPIYAAYTDKSGKFDGKMNIPTAIKEVYLYTEYYGFPKCVKAEITNTGVSYASKTGKATTKAEAPGYDWSKVDKFPYALTNFYAYRQDNVYALYSWGNWGTISKEGQIYITPRVEKSNETMDQFTRRIQNYITSLTVAERRTKLLTNREKADIQIKEDGTTLDLVFMGDAAQYANVFGYYYYTEDEYWGNNFSLGKKIKYVVFPNASYRDSRDGTQDTDLVLEKGTTVKLQYFGSTGTGAPSYEFPKGTKVGWFYGSNSFVRPGTSTGSVTDNGIYDLVSVSKYSSIDANGGNNTVNQRFISLKDVTTNILVLGFEDLDRIVTDPAKADPQQEDYMDVLFYVKSNKDITEDKPEIPIEPEKPEQHEETIPGTVAFEDIWPEGGDYDLNDVIVEYYRTITFDEDNIATKVVEIFKPVHPKGSALQNNFFACQYDNPGTITLSGSEMIFEKETNSVVIKESALGISGKTYTVERDLTGKNLHKDKIKEDFNPYIITKEYTTTNRTEVHLPLKDMTSAANPKDMNKENAYYVGKLEEFGNYPFAIDIPIVGFKPATETYRIDKEGEYPNFRLWAESRGATNTDWYNTGKGAK